MKSAMDFPIIKNYLRGVLRRMPGVARVNFVDSKDTPGMPAVVAGEVVAGEAHDSPFVLVAHGISGQWEVYAKDFEHPLASFDERQAGCDFASNLAKTRDNAIVLIREYPGSMKT